VYNPDWRRSLLAIAIGLSLPLNAANACGPDFQLSLLDNRALSMTELPEGNFSFEVRRLGQDIPGLAQTSERTLAPYWDDNQQLYIEVRELLEQEELEAEHLKLVRQLRSLTDARQAEAEGIALPSEIRLYTAGAVAFANGDIALASEYFQRVLDLPPAERQMRATWAAYSLGRAQASVALNGPGASEEVRSDEQIAQLMQEATDAARKAFQLTRQLSAEGFSDPMELGIASLGEEARVLRAQGDWGTAIRLYASQYRHGSPTGYNSLRQLSGELGRMTDEQLVPLLGQAQVQQLLIARLLSRAAWSYGEQPNEENHLAELLLRSDIATLVDADRLAALSYQFGRYENAARFLEHADDSGLAWWLRAKLALRDGDKARAIDAYAKAAKAFPADEEWGIRRTENWDIEQITPRCRVEGESAILALARGYYLEAFDQLYRSGDIYWLDTAQVAERVLTTDELKGYVDAHVPAAPPETQDDRDNYRSRPPASLLRDLLARRLLREERYAEAPAYFDSPLLQSSAEQYGQARDEAESNWTKIGRAEAYYQAATLAREQGMELLGYEMSPDFHVLGGIHAMNHVDRQQPAGLLSTDEVQRQNTHLAQPNMRYHYRWVAADLANRAADLLPPRSQAFAAVLCKASGWLLYRDLESARTYYKRYVAEGPYVPWAENFGLNCQEPDFERANSRLWEDRQLAVHQAVRPYKSYLFGLAVLATLGAAWYWRRRKASLAGSRQL